VHCRPSAFSETSTTIDWSYQSTGAQTFTNVNSITFDSPSHYTGIKKVSSVAITALEGTRIGDCVSEKAGAH
jgi:hypothetical protein